MRKINGYSLVVIVISAFFISFTSLQAQWTGTNPLYTMSKVGIGLTNPSSPLFVTSNLITNPVVTINNTYSGTGSTTYGLTINNMTTGNNNITYGLNVIGASAASNQGAAYSYASYIQGGNANYTSGVAKTYGQYIKGGNASGSYGFSYGMYVVPGTGSSLAHVYAAYFGGSVGIGTETPLSNLDIKGGLAVGSYAGLNAAPSNGLIVSGNVGIGKTSPQVKLDVAGGIRADSITITSGGADFVFEEKYDLPSLEKVEKYISENKCLPGIAKAKTMQAEGVSVGALQTQLLQKVEELTLYLIEQNKKIKKLEEENLALHMKR